MNPGIEAKVEQESQTEFPTVKNQQIKKARKTYNNLLGSNLFFVCSQREKIATLAPTSAVNKSVAISSQ